MTTKQAIEAVERRIKIVRGVVRAQPKNEAASAELATYLSFKNELSALPEDPEVARLREALKPFSDAADGIHDDEPGGNKLDEIGGDMLFVDDLRQARQALNPKEEGK